METPASGAGAAGDPDLAALRAGDERAFLALVARHHATLVRVAQAYVHDRAVAEEVAQEAWIAVLRGLSGYEGRAPLRTWILAVLVNQARTRAAREARSVPLSALDRAEDDARAVPADRFSDADDRWAGHWRAAPARWPDACAETGELVRLVAEALETLPPAQRAVVALRDVEGCPPEEVCALLGLTDGNARVLLHRGRARVRAWVEERIGERG